jgi:aminoglycoside/choline kinase family phosphotransferase
MKALDYFRAALDPEEIPQDWILERIRNWRNEQLKASDWTQVTDSVCDKTAWATYRQTLRDLPSSNANSHLIEIPVAP